MSRAIDVVLPARTILIAAGTQPNTVLAREEPEWAVLDGRYFRALDEDGNPATPERSCKPASAHVLMSRHADGRTVSFFGDLHPSFAGNVVKAMAGAKQGYPVVSRALARLRPTVVPADAVIDMVNHDMRPVVHDVIRLTPDIVEVVVKAPRAAARFEPGQFYRLQNFETLAHQVDGTTLAMEGLALTGASVDKAQGLLSLIVMEMGGSSDLCALLKAGDPVILMGPTGSPTEIPEGETVCLAGGGLGNAVLFSIGQACRERGNRVVYFAGYKKLIDRYKVERIEAAADVVVWCSDEAPGFAPGRPAGPEFHRQHRGSDAGLCGGGTGAGRNPARRCGPHRRDRLGPHDAGGGDGAAYGAGAVPEAGTCGGRVDQQPDAMHDEGNLRPVPPDAPRSGDGGGVGRVLLLQPGSGA